MNRHLPLPLVGIPCCVKQIDIHPFHAVGEKYINAVAHGAGTMALMIPAFGGGADLDALDALVDLDDLLDRLDGVFLTGSLSNVEPHHYGGHAARPTTARDPQRDALTLKMIHHAIARGMPLMAVCRGIQELNAALGGTLYQHVEEVPGRFDHRADETKSREEQYAPAHTIEVTPGGLLHGITGETGYTVNSIHGQGIDRVADCLTVEAVAPDGQVEAVSHKDAAGFVLGVQWHPEWRFQERPADLALFTAFGDACRVYAAAKGKTPMTADAAKWLKAHRIDDVECMVPDLTGIARGKILPRERFLASLKSASLRLPQDIFYQTVTGEYPEPFPGDPTSPDMVLNPDISTLRLVPWYQEPTAQVICDCVTRDGKPVGVAPRQVLARVLELYAEQNWRPVVTPELEFYLIVTNRDPDYPLEPPEGRSGRQEAGSQAYGIDAVNEFDHVMDDLYDFCEAAGVGVDTLIHESGPAQLEINFHHGDPMALADQVLVFKRATREAGSAMHVHQSVVDTKTGRNVFADAKGRDTKLFHAHIAGLQHYLAAAMPLFAPNLNSYRRLRADSDAPINTHWGYENRTVGLRVPESDRTGRRVENRVAGVDVNPYLAIAGTLACGYLGMIEGREPGKPQAGDAYRAKGQGLPSHLPDALTRFQRSKPLRKVLGDDFVDLLVAVKLTEHNQYQDVISPWEREHLLLNV